MENSSAPCLAEEPPASALPYQDSKPVGAADFYAALNATFRFIRRSLGEEALRRYWHELGRGYYAPVSRRWQAGGLPAVAAYWRDFFAAEPGAETTVTTTPEEVTLHVRTCPAIRYLRNHGREIEPHFCHHCYHVSTAIGEAAGIEIRLTGGNGTCTQRFARQGCFSETQDLAAIATAAGQEAPQAA